MEDFESTAIGTAASQPKRYVDDTFVIWPHGKEKLQMFPWTHQPFHADIEFTIEEEKDNKISFLDTH